MPNNSQYSQKDIIAIRILFLFGLVLVMIMLDSLYINYRMKEANHITIANITNIYKRGKFHHVSYYFYYHRVRYEATSSTRKYVNPNRKKIFVRFIPTDARYRTLEYDKDVPDCDLIPPWDGWKDYPQCAK
jgi:hypothetical protein